ncbi:MAG: SprB repeat-containing protein [Bacteroidetes bacterium]|nr:SprB repeat-containing protein [Bacteroidota bacterium]
MKTTYSKLIMLVALLIFFQIEGFSQTLTLTPSNFNGYNISCFGSATGSVNLTISGGTPPYTFEWSNAATTEDLINLLRAIIVSALMMLIP